MNYKPPFTWVSKPRGGEWMEDADGRRVPMLDVVALLNRSIVDALPEGHMLATLVKAVRDEEIYSVTLARVEAPHKVSAVGTGPTPEAAIQNAKENIRE